MKTKQHRTRTITTTEYCNIRKVSPQSVSQAIRRGVKPLGVFRYKKVGAMYFLTVRFGLDGQPIEVGKNQKTPDIV